MTLDEYLADLAAKAAKATPGPWLAWDRGIGWEVHRADDTDLNDGFRETFSAEDAAHIAAFSPDTAAALVQCAASLRALVSDRHGHSPGCSCPWCVARMNLSRLTALARTR